MNTTSTSPKSPDDMLLLIGAPPCPPAVEAMLRGTYGVAPKSTEQANLWRTITKQPWGTEPARLVVVNAGRRALKSYSAAAVCVFEAIFGEHETEAAEGTRLHFTIVAPTLKQSRETFSFVASFLERLRPYGVEFTTRDEQDQPTLEILSPVTTCLKLIDVVAGNSRHVRGPARPVVVYEEAGHHPEGEHLGDTGEALYKSMSASQAQFARTSRTWVISSPGAPIGFFHRLVTKTPKGAVVIHGPTWRFNDTITEERCRELAGDEPTFEVEYAARRFSYGSGDSFLDGAAIERCRKSNATFGPRSGVVGALAVDMASTGGDDATIAFVSYRYEVLGSSAPIKFAKLEHIEFIPTSRAKPLLAEAFATRIAYVAKAFGVSKVRGDGYQGAELTSALQAKGIKLDIVPMNADAQTKRFLSLREFVSGGRLAVPDTDDGAKILRQLLGLTATTLGNGALRVEARGKGKDDGVDSLVLALSAALDGAPTMTDGGSVFFEYDRVHWDAATHSVLGGQKRFFQRLDNGNSVPIAPPRGTFEFERTAREQIRLGAMSRETIEWLEEEIKAGRDPRRGE